MATNASAVTTVATTTQCPRCFARPTRTTRETYCGECGLVLNDAPIDHGPDWGIAEDGDDPERAAPGNRNHPHRGLGTGYDGSAGDADANRRARVDTHTRLGSSKDRSRGYATSEIHRQTGALDLPRHVGERAKFLFRRLHADTLEGQDLDECASACLYAAMRQAGMGRTAGEVASVARCEERSICRRMWWVAQELGLEVPPPDVRQRVRVVASRLPDDEGAVSRSLSRLKSMPDATVGSGSPSTLAAALLWQAGEWTQVDVADAAGVSPSGIRERRDKLSQNNE